MLSEYGLVKILYRFFSSKAATLFALTVVLFCFLVSFYVSTAETKAATPNIDPTHHYAYGELAGWIDFRPNGGGVEVKDNKLEGMAYGELVGWIDMKPNKGGVLNDGNGNLSGYAYSELGGWINFDPPGDEQVKIQPCTKEFTGMAYGELVGWISFNCSNTGTCGSVDYKVATTWGGASRPPSLTMPIDDKAVDENGTLSFDYFGTDPDTCDRLTFEATPALGFSVSTINNTPSAGQGRFTWSPDCTQSGSYTITLKVSDNSGLSDSQNITIDVNETDECLKWIQTDNGDVHAEGDLNGGLSKGGEFNGSYLITADGAIARFTSKNMSGKGGQNYDLPKNVLTKPDFTWMASNGVSIPAKLESGGEIRLNGYVYEVSGDYTWNFKNAGLDDIYIIGPNNAYGNGTFYIRGDLTIEDNIYIDETNGVGTTITELPSIGFVVLGDLNIDPTVTHINGIFYVTGTVNTGASDQQLTIDGAVFAGSYNLERDLNNSEDPDEVFNYDPRLFINPPPGFLQ